MTDRDRTFMELALRLGRRTMGATGANPAVGCVLVRDDASVPLIIARGWTGVGGRPHAEARALDAAGAAARGATAYVTLEPCAHHGGTPPCASALVAAGVARAVVAIEDPDPRVSGRGFAMLREAGIAVDVGLCAEAARHDLAGFLSRVATGRPHVTLKLAVSRDDKIALSARAPTLITGAEARARSHLLRAASDAILVGIGTALADDPELTCRLPGLEDRSPLRVVLDGQLQLDPASRLAASASQVPALVFCDASASSAREAALAAAGVETVRLADRGADRRDLGEMLTCLGRRGIARLLVEGGATVAAAFVEHDLADEIIVFRAPRTLGANAVDALAGVGLADVLADGRFALWRTRECGEDVMLHYRRADRGSCSQE
jgi:diaminohydroxyphosphoribosylaminopyrimidine deaminase/5-amino-6-(5-phosphoribosylamino)uracil reductase